MSSARLGAFTTAEWQNIQADAADYAKVKASKYTLAEAKANGMVRENSRSGYGYSVAYHTARNYANNYRNAKVTKSNKVMRDSKGKAYTNKYGQKIRQNSVDSKGRAVVTNDKSRAGTKVQGLSKSAKQNMTRQGSPTFNKNNKMTTKYSGYRNQRVTTRVTVKHKDGSVTRTTYKKNLNKSNFRNPSVQKSYPTNTRRVSKTVTLKKPTNTSNTNKQSRVQRNQTKINNKKSGNAYTRYKEKQNSILGRRKAKQNSRLGRYKSKR